MRVKTSIAISFLVSGLTLFGTTTPAEKTIRGKQCLGGSCKNGRVHSVTLTDEYFIVAIDPRSCKPAHHYCPGRYESFTVEGDVPVRVEGYELGTKTEKMFTVYVPRHYERLFVNGINRRENFATIELHLYEKSVDQETTAATGALVATQAANTVSEPAPAVNRNPDALGVVFGIESYRYAPAASYAESDATAFRDYLVQRFGFESDRVLFRVDADATKGEFDRAFASNGWLARRVTGDSDVVVYIAGHGSHDPATGRAVVLPHDIDPAYAAGGYSLDQLLAEFAKLDAASVTVFLDVAFTGVDRDGRPLASDQPTPPADATAVQTPPGVLLFLAAGAEQTNEALPAESHGAFTFFLLEGLSGKADTDDDRRITTTELADFITRNLSAAAQTPQLLGTETDRVILEY
jgi:hypothetical protein